MMGKLNTLSENQQPTLLSEGFPSWILDLSEKLDPMYSVALTKVL